MQIKEMPRIYNADRPGSEEELRGPEEGEDRRGARGG